MSKDTSTRGQLRNGFKHIRHAMRIEDTDVNEKDWVHIESKRQTVNLRNFNPLLKH